MAGPTKEVKQVGEQHLYSMDEQMILAKMETLMNGRPFHYLDMDKSISDAERTTRKAIVEKLSSVVLGIRYKITEGNAFFEYQDLHFDEPDYVWLQEEHPGVNGSGWRIFMILIDPLKYGKNIDRS